MINRVSAPTAQSDQVVTWTAIALAESKGHTTNVPLVFIRSELGPPEAPPSEDSLGLWQINVPPQTSSGAHVAISLGDGGTIEAIEVLVPQPTVFDFLF
jgi:hypothetical protein